MYTFDYLYLKLLQVLKRITLGIIKKSMWWEILDRCFLYDIIICGEMWNQGQGNS